MKILVIRGGALGDFIVTLPVLAALRREFPECRLEILGSPAFASLALMEGLADAVSDLGSMRFSGCFSQAGASMETAAYFAGFDLIISYLHDPNGIFRDNVTNCSCARFIVGPNRPDETLGIHATEIFLQPLCIADADPRPRLTLPSNPEPEWRLAIHPGSGAARKNWPEDNWSDLLKMFLAETSLNFLLIGGEVEGERCNRLAAGLPAERVEIAQNLPLPELAARMKACALFIGHDSGITHLAAALDLPGLVLWGPTALATWRPQSDRLKILESGGELASLAVPTVWRELKRLPGLGFKRR
jgi:ADP-heptose:LPS heptosyltransferase